MSEQLNFIMDNKSIFSRQKLGFFSELSRNSFFYLSYPKAIEIV